MANLRLKFNKPDLKVYPLEEYSLEWVGKAEIYSASKLVNYLYVDISVLKNTDLVYVEYSKAEVEYAKSEGWADDEIKALLIDNNYFIVCCLVDNSPTGTATELARF